MTICYFFVNTQFLKKYFLTEEQKKNPKEKQRRKCMRYKTFIFFRLLYKWSINFIHKCFGYEINIFSVFFHFLLCLSLFIWLYALCDVKLSRKINLCMFDIFFSSFVFCFFSLIKVYWICVVRRRYRWGCL